MDRSLIYELEQIRAFDTLWGWRDAMIGVSDLGQMMLGSNQTVIQGLLGTQTTSPSLTVNISAGQVLELADIDSSPYGSLDGDTDEIMQQGEYVGGQLTLTPTVGSGQSQWFLVQAGFAQVDAIRVGDPDGGILPYVNVDDPTQPLEGPGGSNVPQDTVRQGLCLVQLKPGAAATTGSEVPPTADANFVPAYLIHINFGQTTITSGQILVAGPAAHAGYQVAPFFPGIIGTIPNATSGSHHGGVAGQANKINLTNGAEVTGIAALANLPVTNANPPVAGGAVILGGEIPILIITNINPQGNIAGNQGDICYNETLGFLFCCTTSGSSSTAVWGQIGNPGTTVLQSTSPFVPLPGYINLVDTTAGIFVANLGVASTYGGSGCSFKVIGPNQLQVFSASGEVIENGAWTHSVPMVLNQLEATKLGPQTGVGWWIVP